LSWLISATRATCHVLFPRQVERGDADTLVPTQDSVDLATAAPLGELKLYPNDDHCAMGHYDESTGYATRWLRRHLATP
jgi:esterase FrsA